MVLTFSFCIHSFYFLMDSWQLSHRVSSYLLQIAFVFRLYFSPIHNIVCQYRGFSYTLYLHDSSFPILSILSKSYKDMTSLHLYFSNRRKNDFVWILVFLQTCRKIYLDFHLHLRSRIQLSQSSHRQIRIFLLLVVSSHNIFDKPF